MLRHLKEYIKSGKTVCCYTSDITSCLTLGAYEENSGFLLEFPMRLAYGKTSQLRLAVVVKGE